MKYRPEIYRQKHGNHHPLRRPASARRTIMGTGRYLKEVNPRISSHAVEPDDALHGLEV